MSRSSARPVKWGIVWLSVASLAGCTQEMANQPRLEPLEPSPLAGDIVPPREPIVGTVARGQYWPDEQFLTGRADGEFATMLPPSLSDFFDEDEVLLRGAQRFQIFCAPCHGLLGGGEGGDIAYRPQVGMVVLRGFPTPPTYHQTRLREAPLGHLFDVITHGIGRMPAHGSMIPPEDRWAIAAYVKALQLSQYAPRELLSPDDLQRLSEAGGEDD